MQRFGKIILCGILFALSMDASAARYFYNGNDLMEFATESDKLERNDPSTIGWKAARFSGYVLGSLDTLEDGAGCRPNLSVTQAAAIVSKYLREHPEKRHLRGFEIVRLSMVEAFPCGSR